MDNINKNVFKREGLKVNTYDEYINSWNKLYKQYEIKIDKIIKENNLHKIDKIFEKEWFKKRVFDIFLQRNKK